MPDQIAKHIRSERVKRLTTLETELRSQYFQQLVGSKLELLVESSRDLVAMDRALLQADNPSNNLAGTPTDRLLRGTTCRYAPGELMMPTEVDAGTISPSVGDLLPVRIIDATHEKLMLSLLN